MTAKNIIILKERSDGKGGQEVWYLWNDAAA